MYLQRPFHPDFLPLPGLTTINRTLQHVHKHPSKPGSKEEARRSPEEAFQGEDGLPLLPKVKPALHERVVLHLALRA